MKRYEIIQALIDHNKYRSYLEMESRRLSCSTRTDVSTDQFVKDQRDREGTVAGKQLTN